MQNSTWTVIFEDKKIVKSSGDMASTPTGYKILDDDAFWNQSKFSNIWAIQYEVTPETDQVEYRDGTPHSSYADANLGSFDEFINRWDFAHLRELQRIWDEDNEHTLDQERLKNDPDGEYDPTIYETEEEKIARLGPRPSSYSST